MKSIIVISENYESTNCATSFSIFMHLLKYSHILKFLKNIKNLNISIQWHQAIALFGYWRVHLHMDSQFAFIHDWVRKIVDLLESSAQLSIMSLASTNLSCISIFQIASRLKLFKKLYMTGFSKWFHLMIDHFYHRYQ